MPFQIVRNDVTTMFVNAIVNITNPDTSVRYGVDMGIHQAARPELLFARKKSGSISIGCAGTTDSVFQAK